MTVDTQNFEYGGDSLSTTFDAAVYQDMLVLGFSVVLFSLIIQGLTMRPLLQRLGISGAPAEAEVRYEVALAEVIGSRAALRRLSALNTQGLISDEDKDTFSEPYRERVRDGDARIRDLSAASVVHASRVERARKELIIAQIQALRDAERSGAISSIVATQVLHGLDEALGKSEHAREVIQEAGRHETPSESVVEEDDFEALIPESTENVIGHPVTESEEE